MSAYEEDRKSHSKSPLEEPRLSNYARPLTAKRSEPENSKIQKKTIFRFNTRQKKMIAKDRNTPILTKLRPTKIAIDKEKLYIENMALKVKNNELKEILTKHKSKITHLERELQKKEESNGSTSISSNSYLVKLLKQTIKSLKAELLGKDQEIEKQKQNIKLSKFLEMELEVKAYMDECTRLRHYLEEVLKEREDEDTTEKMNSQSADAKTINLLKIIEENNKEIQKLKEKLKSESNPKNNKTPKFQEEFSKASKELENCRKEFLAKEKKMTEEIEKARNSIKEHQKKLALEKMKLEESNVLIENLYKELKSLRQKKKSKISPPKCLRVLHSVLGSTKSSIQDYLSKISASKSHVEVKDFLASLRLHDSSIGSEDVSAIITYVRLQDDTKISIKKLIDYYNTYDFSLIDPATNKSKAMLLFEHLSLRMQLHRIPKENLIEALIGAGATSSKTIHSQEIVLLFTNTPFSFSRKQATVMVDHLFAGEKTITYSGFVDKFYSTISDWEIFTSSDEENFDGFLLTLVAKYKDEIEKYCSDKDSEDKGIVTLEEFKKCIQFYSIVIPERIQGYLLVLFYSHNMELNSVPYKQFLQAYSNNEDPSPEDYKTALVQKYLDMISERLISKQMTPRAVFAFDENGFIVAEDFIGGLKTLGVEDIPKENLLVLLEALQYNPEERVVCIHINELEEILETYGVTVEPNLNVSEMISDSEILAELTEGHVQKISLLDSAQMGLSETPEPGPRTSRVSFGNSFS